MNTKIALLGIIEVLSAITIGVTMLSITYKLVIWFGKKYYDISERTPAFSLFTASILFAVGYMMVGVIQPLISSFRLLDPTDTVWLTALKYVGTGAVYIAIAFVSGLVVAWLGTSLYARLTPIDEWDEIKNNNHGIAIVISAIVIMLTLMTRSGVMLIIESLIPYPVLPPAG